MDQQELSDESFGFEPMDITIPPENLNPDGSLDVTLDDEPAQSGPGPFDQNLVEVLPEDETRRVVSDLMTMFESDKQSRKEWEEAYVKGLDLLGMKIEDRNEPWPGACGVFHPLLTEAVVRFQAQTITEIFPAGGPVQTKIVGEETNERVAQARRVKNELNYLLTEKMTEFRSETEQMLFRLPLAGCAFKKVYFDPLKQRPCSMFVPAEDFVVAYGASSLESAERYTHIMRKTASEVKKLQAAGYYAQIDLMKPTPEYSDVDTKTDELSGQSPSIESDDRHSLLEIHVDYEIDLDGPLARPYVVTLDKISQKVLSIRRNWVEGDPLFQKRMHFVHYPYIPGLGFYGTGLIHLMGGLAKTSTSILRQLIDAGTLSNLPGGLKTRGLRIKGDDRPILPGEWRDVDTPGGVLKDSLFPLPYKEPSSVLFQLLGSVVDEGRRIGSIADLQVGEMSQNAPVGTTLALLERSLKVMSAVQARVHWALHEELNLIADIVKMYMPPQYEYDVGQQGYTRQGDFDNRVDIIPVSDPNASTMSQRVVRMQAALTLAAQAPHLYNLPALHRQAMEALDVAQIDLILPMDQGVPIADPVSENMNLLMQKPVKAYYYQDHQSHIRAHMDAAKDPQIQSLVMQSPQAQSIQSALAAHVTEHLAFAYRKKIEQMMGVELPDIDTPLPEEVEFRLSRSVADAADKVLAESYQEAAKEQALQEAQDPLTQIQKRELDLKESELALKALETSRKIELEKAKIASKENIAAAQLGVELITDEKQAEAKKAEASAREAEAAASQLGLGSAKAKEKTKAKKAPSSGNA